MTDTDETREPSSQPGDAARSHAEAGSEIPEAEEAQSTDVVMGMTPSDPLVGARIGDFEIVRALGAGGFGTVYAARDVTLGRDVALKFLRDPLVREHSHLFKREAKALAALSKHPSIVQIYTWGEYQDRNYFALEFVASSASDLLQRNPKGLAPTLALRIAAECADALAYAHKQGILHRDVKPGNILIEAENHRAKLADFGLAKFFESAEASFTAGVSGSPPYMSPEQANGQMLDERSDVFSLGSTLYELLSGRRPFEGTSRIEIMENVRQGNKASLRKYCPNLADSVVDVVEKAIAHDPRERFQSAHEFADALNAALASLEGTPTIETRRLSRTHQPRRMTYWVALIAAGVCAAGAAWLLLRQGSVSSPALAQAKQKLDAGDAQAAEQLYRAFLQEHPDADDALFGLGYALLQQGKNREAEAEFMKVLDASKQSEGVAAVVFERGEPDARQRLEASSETVHSAYPGTLLASLDLSAGDYAQAAERLRSVAEKPFSFGWQRAQYLQALGQTQYHLGAHAEALKTFGELRECTSPAAVSFATAYIDMLGQQSDEARRQSIREQVAQVKKRMIEAEAEQDVEEMDPWTSRPLTFYLLPADPGKSRIATWGLADLLPAELGKALVKRTPMDGVERELIQEVLAEQDLSAQLSSPAGKLRLGKVLGARLMIECTFQAFRDDEFVSTKVVDTETTVSVPVEDADLKRNIELEPWVQALAEGIWAAIGSAYPIQGRVLPDAKGPRLNIGARVGVMEGMRFQVYAKRGEYAKPGADHVLPGRTVIVQGPVGEDNASVALEGLTIEDIPKEGLCIRAEEDAPPNEGIAKEAA